MPNCNCDGTDLGLSLLDNVCFNATATGGRVHHSQYIGTSDHGIRGTVSYAATYFIITVLYLLCLAFLGNTTFELPFRVQ